MNKNVKKKIQEYVDQEHVSPIDEDLLTNLHLHLEEETLYWDLVPAKRNALNSFFKELHDEFLNAMITDKYGAHIVIDSLIVTSFEVGYRLGLIAELATVDRVQKK